MNFDFKKKVDENDKQYIWRICQYKDSGLFDMNWDDVADILNKELGNDDMPFQESAYRKPYQQAKRFYDAGVFGNMSAMDYSAEIREQKHELEKEKVRVRDERNELRRIIREEARKESFVDQVKRAVSENVGHPLEYDKNTKFEGMRCGDNDLIVTLTDLHTGLNIDNSFNKFNADVLKSRLNDYLDKIMEIQMRHASRNAHVVISEIISGLIHLPLRIEANQNVIEQFLTAIDYISEFLSELSYKFDNVNVYIAPGNHSRVIANKNDLGKGENFDHLIIPYLEAKLQNFDNVKCHTNDIEESVAVFTVRNSKVFAVHGDKDAPSNVVNKLTLMFGEKPDIIMTSHRHTNAMSTEYNTKVIQSGCLSGSDSYCMDNRLNNKPEQVVAVIDNDGLTCLYDIKFD